MLMDKRLLRMISRRAWRWIGAVILFGWGIVILNFYQIIMIGNILDRLQLNQLIQWQLFLILLGIFLIKGIFGWFGVLSGHKAAAETKVLLRDRLYDHIVKLGPGFLNDERTGALVNTAVEGVENLEIYFGRYLPQLFLGLSIPLLLCVAIGISIDWVTAAILLFCQPLIPLSLMIIQKRLAGVSEEYWKAANCLSAQFLDSLQGLPTLKMFNQSKAWGQKLEVQTEELRKDTMRLLAVNQISLFGIDLVSTLGTTVLTSVIVILRSRAGYLSFGEAVAVLLLSVELARPLALLGSFFHAGASGVAAAQDVFRVLETPIMVKSTGKNPTPGSLKPTIEFDNVVFSYPNQENEAQSTGEFHRNAIKALSGVSFKIETGETVGLVGASGAGKTSIFNLLLRYFDPQSGRILLDGQPIDTFPLQWLRSQFSLVAQDAYLFHGTIAENLLLANPDATQRELEEAATVANIHDFILSLPNGYNSLISERGASLSGGQVQRIAIARAILKNAPIILFDEATSNIDTFNESTIQKAIENIADDKIVMVIAHRLSTIRNMNRILVMNNGNIVEQGSHESLIKQRCIYTSLNNIHNNPSTLNVEVR